MATSRSGPEQPNDPASGTKAANDTFDQGISVTGAAMSASNIVELSILPMRQTGTNHTLSVSNVME